MSEETNHIEAAITDLEGWLDRISTAIETLRHFRSGGGALPSGGLPPLPGGSRIASADISHDTFFQMTVPDAAEKYLGLVKKTKPNTELAESLLKGGLKSSSQNFSEMVRSVLARDARFVKVNSEWGLNSWYPGLGKGKKTKVARAKKSPKEPKSLKKPARHQSAKVHQVGSETLSGLTLKLLNANPSKTFSAPEVAGYIKAPTPSVAAALSGLLKQDKITRPTKGRYQCKAS